MIKAIPYGKQFISDDDIDAVVKALRSDYLTQGPMIQAFEEAFASYIGCKYAVAVANGTAALHLSALALNVAQGDKVITTPITFAASANCIRYCGGDVVFADIDPSTYLINLTSVREILQGRDGKSIKGIIPVDFAGRAVDMAELRTIADEFGVWILEDACHAPGGYFTDRNGRQHRCGNGSYAELAIFSFHPVKHIACGEGGMITTNDNNLYRRLIELRTHGITRQSDSFLNPISLATGGVQANAYPGWYMEMQSLGFNYRLTDFQAALGVSQLKRADSGLQLRREIARTYDQAFRGADFILGSSGVVEGHAYHLFILQVKDRLGLYNFLRTKNIFAQIHYIPTHLMPYYADLGWKKGDLPHAEKYYESCISLPMYPTLTRADQAYVIEQIKAYYHA